MNFCLIVRMMIKDRAKWRATSCAPLRNIARSAAGDGIDKSALSRCPRDVPKSLATINAAMRSQKLESITTFPLPRAPRNCYLGQRSILVCVLFTSLLLPKRHVAMREHGNIDSQKLPRSVSHGGLVRLRATRFIHGRPPLSTSSTVPDCGSFSL